MDTLTVEIIKKRIDLRLELRSANGSSTEFYQDDEERVHEALRLLAAPRLFAQPHLLLASQRCASMIPCPGIDMILACTTAQLPLKFPVDIPAGRFDLVELPSAGLDNKAVAIKDQNGRTRRRYLQLEIQTLGGWAVTLGAVAMFRGSTQDERQFFSQLPALPAIPFRRKQGGFGLINTANITRVSAWPRPETLPGTVLPLTLCRQTPAQVIRPTNLADSTYL